MYQCATDDTHVLYLKSGVKDFEEVDAAEVRRRYGIGPELVPDFIALRGDPSDGLPGAPGIGAKGAAELLRDHGSREGAIEAAGRVSSRMRPRTAAALLENERQLRAFKEIATLQSMPLPRPPDT